MPKASLFPLLPYSRIVGQETLKLALELAYINPAVSGVLISGQRGTAKSTAVRAFAQMVYGRPPVTLPINATEDRVVGGWRIKDLMDGKTVWQDGLLKEAAKKLLYIDEVNLLDDHLVNLILDAASTGVLVVQREAHSVQEFVSFTLVGTMNPEEGGLRPQLLDRFGLMVEAETEKGPEKRLAILETVLNFDEAVALEQQKKTAKFLEQGRTSDEEIFRNLEAARTRLPRIKLDNEVLKCCATLADVFQVEGHRAERIMAHAVWAFAARRGTEKATVDDVKKVARLALQHRRSDALRSDRLPWSADDDRKIASA